MAYTVKKLAHISGISVRTLHFYDEVGLLSPAYHGTNGYRYYEEPQLLLLQQILFYRELGFELKEIQKIVKKGDFDKVAALNSHRKTLEKELVRIRRLIRTIDHTVEHIRGTKKMKDTEIFDGFYLSVVQKSKKGDPHFEAEEILLKSQKKQEKVDKDAILEKAHGIFRELVRCIDKGLSPQSEEVQRIIKKHHAFTSEVHTAPKEVYRAMAELYEGHSAFRKQLDPFHPELATFMASAMKRFADKSL